jgi:multidrug efflux pump subunit AcrA (membrane-fusion protein)
VSGGIVEPSDQSKRDQQGALASVPARATMVQRLLEASGDLPAFLTDLITTQAVVVAGTEAAAFIIEKQAEQPGLRPVAHVRPGESSDEARAAALQAFVNLVLPCVSQGKDGAIAVGAPEGPEPQFCLVTLLRAEGQIVAASAVITRCHDGERAKQRLGSMQLVAGYFELFTLRRHSDQSRALAERHQNVLQCASAISTAEGFDSSAMNLCNELANRMGASRVSLGWKTGYNIKVKALSHTEKFDKKQELIVQLQQVMEECIDQEEPVRFDSAGPCSQNITRCAKALTSSQGNGAVLSVPLRRKDQIVGAITAEFLPGEPLDPELEQGLVVAADLIASQLYDRWENDRFLIVKAGHSAVTIAKATIGPKHTLAKVLVVLSLALVAGLVFYKPMYHVSSTFQLIAKNKQTLCAPFDGYLGGDIDSVRVKPGQIVKKGEVLASLDTKPMEIELADQEAQVRSKQAEADQYMTDKSKIAQRSSALADRDAAQAKADKLKLQIAMAQIKAPFDGVVLKGDWMDKKGNPVRQSDVMFEVAANDPAHPGSYAIEAELNVSERDIQELGRPGQTGTLATSSAPDKSIPIVVTRVVPSGEAHEGENVFKVYADVKISDPGLHPGLAGEARVDTSRRRLIWIWTHRLVDFLKLKLWI